MAQFTFQLDGVLRHRKHLEDQCLRVVAEAQAAVTASESTLRAINADIQQNAQHMREHHLLGKLDMAFLAGHRRYVAALHRKAGGLAQQLNFEHQRLETARRELGEAAKARKMIEKLRERKESRWKLEQARREVAALDDVSMQIAISNLNEATICEGFGASNVD